MIEEVAIVSQIHKFQVYVQTMQTSSCGKCMQKDSCGTSLLDKYMGKRDVVVDSDLNLKCGDKVVVGIHESSLIMGSLLLYLVPLLALLGGALLGQYIAVYFTLTADLMAATSAFGCFAISLLFIHLLQKTLLLQFFARPVVLRKLAG